MKIVGVIPARGGSKGIPGKNKKVLMGKPLIAYTIEAALKSELNSILVSSDDTDILEIAESFGIHAIQRPSELADDYAFTLNVIHHALASLNMEFDAVMTLQPTSPLRTFNHINTAIQLFSDDNDADSLITVVQVPHKFSENSQMILDGKYIRPFNEENIVLRRQEKPTIWARNGAAIYITRRNRIKDFIFGGKIIPMEMNKLESVDIDDMEDWVLAEAMILYKKSIEI